MVDELAAATKRRDYLAANPDLPEANTDPIPGVDPTPDTTTKEPT